MVLQRTVARAVFWWVWVVTALALMVLLCNLWIVNQARPYTYFSMDSLPVREAALVLGTSNGVSGGGHNLSLKHRMQATPALFNQGKVKSLILSGNNDPEYY